MALISNYLENKLCNDVFRTNDVYIGLLYADPTDESKSYEIIGKGYCRELVDFDTPIDGIIKNKHDVVFHKATSPWDTVTHIGLFDEDAGGNLLFHGAVSKPVKVGKHKNFFIKHGDLQVGFE